MRQLFGIILIMILGTESYAQSGCLPKLSKNAFQIELKKIKTHDFDQAKKEAIELLLSQCLTSFQLKQLLRELSFEEDKLEIAKKAYAMISDPSNFGIIKDVFDFEDVKKEIDALMN